MDKAHLWLDIRILFMLSLILVPFVVLAFFFKSIGYPVWIVGVVAVLFLLFDYHMAIKHTLSSVNATELTGDTENEQELIELVEKTSTELNVPTPSVYIGELKGPNAFATGRKGNGHIVLSPQIVQILTKTELEAVIAHEMSHLKSRDIFPLVLTQGVGYFVGLLLFEISLVIVPKNKNKTDGRYVLLTKTQNFFELFSRPVSRKREYVADEDAAKALGTGSYLKSALQKISTGSTSPPETASQLCISNKATSGLSQFFSTHPPLENRIKKLDELS